MAGYVSNLYNAIAQSSVVATIANSRPVSAIANLAARVGSAFSAVASAPVVVEDPAILANRALAVQAAIPAAVVPEAEAPAGEAEDEKEEIKDHGYQGSVPVEMTMSGSMDSSDSHGVVTSRMEDSGLGSMILVEPAKQTIISSANSAFRETFPSLYDSAAGS